MIEPSNKPESPQSLFQQPIYWSKDASSGHEDFWTAVSETESITWDLTAIYSLMCFSYVAGDRTLVQEVRRQPWLAKDDRTLVEIPAHGRKWESADNIASGLIERLENELATVCEANGQNEICILQSGGLDSRIVAGVYRMLLDKGRISVKPKAVTWGIKDSRDVHYGRLVAEKLGFDWTHVDLNSKHFENNIMELSSMIGNMVSPVHFHRMDWFQSLGPDALVLAGSYGDSVGRSEFSGQTVLELSSLRPRERTHFLHPHFRAQAAAKLRRDLKEFNNRGGNQPAYVLNEHEQQGHYMRSHIAHVMSVINRFCRVYQLFTHPSVYSYMWSFHPAARTDEVYTQVLKQLGHDLVEIPWARTNVSLTGHSKLSKPNLRSSYHNYRDWSKNVLEESLLNNREFLRQLEWIDYEKLEHCLKTVCKTNNHNFGFEYYEFLIWLLSLQTFCQECGSVPVMPDWKPNTEDSKISRPTRLRLFVRKIGPINRKLKVFRRKFLRLKSRFQFPPE